MLSARFFPSVFLNDFVFENVVHFISQMDKFKRTTVALLHFIKQLNLFNTYTTDRDQIRREIITTRIYLILLPTILTVLIVYSAQKELYHVVQVSNPSLHTYQQLLNTYPNTLLCPCSQLSVPYSAFVILTPRFHPICSSDFISDRWIDYLYYDDASSYLARDIRSVGNAQFQLLRTLCESSKEAIVNALTSIFTSVALVSSRGMLLQIESVRVQVESFTDEFISNIASEHRRRRALFATFLDRNFLVSGLKTSSIPILDRSFSLTMETAQYFSSLLPSSYTGGPNCPCDMTYICEIPLGICNNSFYELEYSPFYYLITTSEICPTVIHGFISGCLPLNALLESTLECYFNQSCLDNIMNYLPAVSAPFNILHSSVLNRSFPTTSTNTLADNLMVEEWSTEMNYSLYFAACHPSSCVYTYTERFSILYIVTTLIGLLGGLIAILRLLCPQLTKVFDRIRRYILGVTAKNRTGSLLSGKRNELHTFFKEKESTCFLL